MDYMVSINTVYGEKTDLFMFDNELDARDKYDYFCNNGIFLCVIK